MSRSIRSALIASFALSFAACGDHDPVSHSAPVGIELKADADKVATDSLTDEKGITTESGNPYGTFIAEAQGHLGTDPSRIEVHEVTLLLGANSTGVTALNEIFDGEFEVLFVMNDTNDTFPVASRAITASTQGAGPLTLDIDFDDAAFVDTNLTKLIGGNFKVVYRGPTNDAYAATTAKANLQITFTFEAFE